ncbi:MAG: hypothetical protein EA362_09625, partial [Saprospirales bacterium]
VFVFALMGVLFFACQKDERVVEQSLVDSTEMGSVERSIDYLPCFQQGNCPCIIMSNMDPFPHWATTCMTGLNLLYNSVSNYMQPAIGGLPPSPLACTLPNPTCGETDPDILNSDFGFFLQFHNIGGYNYGDFYHFCMTPDNIARVCNPHPFPIDMHLMCNPDAPNHQMATFTLAPVNDLQGRDCKAFRITNQCHIEDCN